MTAPNPDHCQHGNTVVFSHTLNIDKCRLCGAYLVWCDLPKHEADRHWHGRTDANAAAALARTIAALRPPWEGN